MGFIMLKSKTVLLVSLDTTRTDVLFSGKFPFIEKKIKESITFKNAVVSAPLTPVSHASVFTGQLPNRNGIKHLFVEKLGEETVTLAEIFKKYGYSTGAIVSCPGLNRWYKFDKGFDYYNDELVKLPDGTDALNTVDVEKRGSVKRRANVVVDLGKKFLKKNYNKNTFLFLHFFDAHWPYDAPIKFGGENCYEQEIYYSLHYLEEMLENLSLDSYYDDLTLIMFNDHGEDLNGLYLNDKGGELLGHPEEKGHGCLLYNQTIKSFIMFYHKDLKLNFVHDDYVHLVDLFPTVCDIFNFTYDKSSVDGLSLLPYFHDKNISNKRILFCETYYPEEFISNFGIYKDIENKEAYIFSNRFKLIISKKTNKVELYDLENDVFEEDNLIER